jgi:glutathione S-transferase
LTERLKVIENALKDKEWLVGSKVTIADIALASTLNSLYSLYLDEKNRKGYPNTMKWFTNVTNIQAWKTEFGRPRLC